MNFLQKIKSSISVEETNEDTISKTMPRQRSVAIGYNEHPEYNYKTVGTTLIVEPKVPFIPKSLTLEQAGIERSSSFVLVTKESIAVLAARTSIIAGSCVGRRPSLEEVDLISFD